MTEKLTPVEVAFVRSVLRSELVANQQAIEKANADPEFGPASRLAAMLGENVAQLKAIILKLKD